MLKKKLESIALFAALDEDELEALAAISEIKTYQEGSLVFSEGDTGKDIYFLVSGVVSIRKKISSGFKTLAVLRDGDLFGEMSFFENAPRSADAFAPMECDILSIKGEAFEAFLSDKPRKSFSMLMKMLAISSSRLRNMDRYFTTLYQTARIMATCASLAELAEKILPELINSLPVSAAALYTRSLYENEYKLIAAIPAMEDVSISGDTPFILRLASGEAFCDDNVKDVPGMRFFAPIAGEDGLAGFIALASEKDPALEDRILVGTICNMINPVIINLRTKQEDLMKSRLKEQKWQL